MDLLPASTSRDWPDIPYAAWKDTAATLQLWMQIVGKVRLALTPWLNHSWHVPLYVTSRGLDTSPIPYGARTFEIAFDFQDHVLTITTSEGSRRELNLEPKTVADFQARLMETLGSLDIAVNIYEIPSEIPDAIPFRADNLHRDYDRDAAHRFWRALVQVDRVLKLFRTGFIGKCSPVHFFWGSFDLAVTRFSGRRAPLHPGGVPGVSDDVTREAYSHEVSSAGFWPGGNGIDYPAFYSYAFPTPDDFKRRPVEPEAAFFSDALGEFLLPYDAVRTAADPDSRLIAFLQSTYDAAATTARWDREALECPLGRPGIPRPLDGRGPWKP
ncbi:DUF5996 family protein [Rhodomicrobium lacus]|uniref:DUF5996 family protein n=1 Tax=Rhodomicrobium lacus TaxID=2498452 RepID=UPI0026E16741|nr:DUF5996 family protein [Rhodomicrobium lacus]WKW51335.1 DUF5996 family protein [Rhodomicrobium lacus]